MEPVCDQDDFMIVLRESRPSNRLQLMTMNDFKCPLFSAFRLRSSLSDSSPGGSLKLKQLSSKHFEPLKALGNIMFLPTFFGIGRAGFVSKRLLHSVGSI